MPKLRFIKGILNGKRAFAGPEVLHIDLTNKCNNNCIACWCRSPLLKDKEMEDWLKNETLPFPLIKDILRDIRELGGTKEIKLVGGGEPLMHPDIMEIIRIIKEMNISVDINTNFTLVNRQIAEEMVKNKVDLLTVSLWAGDSRTYIKTHPNKNRNDFEKIKENLKYIRRLKKKYKTDKPWIRLYNVIFNMNYNKIQEMIDFGLETGAEEVHFVPMDPIPGRTDVLLLSDKQKNELIKVIGKIPSRFIDKTLDYEKNGKHIQITALPEFKRRILSDKNGSYDERCVERFPCYVGWLFARILAHGIVVPCCKGHKMNMGNVYEKSFKQIWNGIKYETFRKNGLKLEKSHHYFLKIGNEANKKTGCYNCDNLWQNDFMHKIISNLSWKDKIFMRFVK